MSYAFDRKAFQPNVEICNLQKNIDKRNKEGVEIFADICDGKDLTKHGDKVDKVVRYMKNLGERALAGDNNAQAEINAIREIQIEAPLLKRINLFDYMGDFHAVGYDEELWFKVYQLQGKKSGDQASSGSFPFPTQVWRRGTMPTKIATGGIAVDYREVASMNTDSIARANEQVVTDLLNQMFYNVITNLHDSIADISASGIAVYSEADAINKTVLDEAIRIIRRWGPTTITGDYAVVSQINSIVGTTVNATTQFSEAVLEEIRKTGLVSIYNGTPVVEIPNSYNLSVIDPDGGLPKDEGNHPYFATYLPENLLFLIPKMVIGSPLQVGIKGGVTSMSGVDINLRLNVQRFDMEYGSTVIPEYVPTLGLIAIAQGE